MDLALIRIWILTMVAATALSATVTAAEAAPVPATDALPVVAPGSAEEPLARRDPAVGMAADGRFAVAYVEDEPPADSKLWLQRFDAAGARVGARVSAAGGPGSLFSPALAMSADGQFVVAYDRRASDGSEQHVEFRHFDANAIPLGPPVIPGPAVSVDESAPDIGLAEDGRVAIAWRNIEDVAGTLTWRLRYRAYGADGNPRFDERDASSEDLFDQAAPSLAMASDGRFVLTWERRFTFLTTRDVPARRFGGDGEPAGDVFLVFSGAVGGASGNGRPAAGIASTGAFAVAWEGATDQFDAGISARLFSAGGAAAGDPFRADELDARGLSPSVAIDDDGTLFAAYECYNGCPEQVAYLREYAPDGTPRGGGVTAGRAISDGRIFPEVATDRKGRVVVAWGGNRRPGPEAYVRRFNATPPPPPDVTPPTTTIALATSASSGRQARLASPVSVTVSAVDNAGGSGVAETRCVLDPVSVPATFDDLPSAPCPFLGSGANVTAEGLHTVYAASLDKAGNKEAPVVSRAFEIDSAAPITSPAPPPPPAALACEADKLVLTDVYPLAGKTRLLGAAPRGSAGQAVRLVSTWNGKQVALATVRPDLSFTAAVPLPPKSLRSTNRARYVAKFGGKSSSALKFARRMYTTQLRISDGPAERRRVTFAGSVLPPYAKPIQRITIVVAGSCSGIARGATVARLKPSRRGRFSATFALPPSLASLPVVFVRAQTRVPRRAGGRTFSTYTLIRSVRGA